MFVDKLQVTPYDPATQYFEHMIFKTIFPEVFFLPFFGISLYGPFKYIITPRGGFLTLVRSVLTYMKKGEDRGWGSEIDKKGVIMYLNSPIPCIIIFYTVERVIFAPAFFSRFFENEVFAQCYFRGSRRSRKKRSRKKMNSKVNTAAVKKRQRKKRSTRCRLQTLY